MKNHLPKSALIVLLLAATLVRADEPKIVVPGTPAAPAAPATYTKEQLLEEFGWIIAMRTGLSSMNWTPAEADQISKGVVEALNRKDTPYDLEKIGPMMSEFVQKKQNAVLEDLRGKNMAEAAAFFTKLKENKNVVELPDGLRYEVLIPGSGASPTLSDSVDVVYTGSLLNGTVFDSSEKAGKPVTIPLGSVIAGWKEGLQKMSKGSKFRFYIPPQLAYGDNGQAPAIPPGATLIFEVQLVDFAPTPAAPATPAAK